MRGSHPGSFEDAHALRDATPGLRLGYRRRIRPDRRRRGISGLAAAHYYRAHTSGKSRILILDITMISAVTPNATNSTSKAVSMLLNGGTLEIDSPRPYGPSPQAF